MSADLEFKKKQMDFSMSTHQRLKNGLLLLSRQDITLVLDACQIDGRHFFSFEFDFYSFRIFASGGVNHTRLMDFVINAAYAETKIAQGRSHEMLLTPLISQKRATILSKENEYTSIFFYLHFSICF